MRFRDMLRGGVAATLIAAMAAPSGFAETGPVLQRAPGSPLSVSVAQADNMTRIEFRWPGAVKAASRREGQNLILHFSRYAKPDMTHLRVDPPKFLKGAVDRDAGGLEITLTLADGADAKVGEADGATFVNLFAAQQAAAQPATGKPSPVPDGGVVKVVAQNQSGRLLLNFPWKAPLGAAVFRRGEAIWIVFDAAAKLDLGNLPRTGPLYAQVQPVQGADFSALRIVTAPGVSAAAGAQGGDWSVTLSPTPSAASDNIKVTRDDASALGALTANVAGSTRVIWIDDPAVKDKIAVVTALAPAKGLSSRREYVDLALLPSTQGLAVEPIADDVQVSTDGDVVSLGRPKGLALSTKSGQAIATQDLGLPQPAVRPGLIDFDNWSKTGSGGFLSRYDALQSAAADEVNKGQGAGMAARMGLARFLVGSELSYEAIGVLNMVAKSQQGMLSDAEFRGLRGAAKAMAGRYKEAQTEFSVPILADDPASSLWRGYIDDKLGQWADARKEFAAGQGALFQFAPKWRARFETADAEASVALGLYPIADSEINHALIFETDPQEQLETRLIQAKMLEAEGQKGVALNVYSAVSNVNIERLAIPALLHATLLRQSLGQITPVQAADVLEGLRYRWRGDATELDTIRALGQIYLSLGRYREALDALRSAGQRMPDLPQAVQIQQDLSGAFRGLFLDGQADGLQPIQALALFYDFKELTPIGSDGDLIVRKLARRLVDVDLLAQAADLLKYQEENRLDGVPRAEVATDLATIDLMNRQPEQAIDALNESRTTLLPSALNAQRRAVEARAWMMLGQYDHATEIIEGDKSPDVAALRADIAWKQHNWASAGVQLGAELGDRWKNPTPLSQGEEGTLLRCAISLSLAGDETDLAALRDRYQGFVAQARSPDALRVALAGLKADQMGSADFARVAAEDDSFVGWVQAMKQRFRATPATQTAMAAAGGRA